MNMVRWQPFTEMMTLRQAMDRLFEDSFTTPFRLIGATANGLTAPVDIYHTDKDVVVKAALPGVKPEEVEIGMPVEIVLKPEGERIGSILDIKYFKPV